MTKREQNRNSKIGLSFLTIGGYTATIIEYINNINITVEFNDERKSVRKGVSLQALKEGGVCNLYHPSFLGVGYIGEGKYKSMYKGGKSKIYAKWEGMLGRCYNPDNRNLTYSNTDVCEEWHNFQNFAKWFDEHYNFITMEKWHLDKDIISPNCKIYSPETCCFVPSEINNLFRENIKSKTGLPRGIQFQNKKYSVFLSKESRAVYIGCYGKVEEAREVYLKAKREYVKEVADKYKKQLKDHVYQAIINFPIEIL